MGKYRFETSKISDDTIEISAKTKHGEKHGFVQISSNATLDRKNLLAIAQLHVRQSARGHGLGSRLASRAILHILSQDKGIHMLLQPGSSGFWKKYFKSRFNGKKITLLGGLERISLFQNLEDGKVCEMSKESLTHNYRCPVDSALRDRAMAKICSPASAC